MKRKFGVFILVFALIGILSCSAQNANNGINGYAGSRNSLQDFKKRFSEIAGDGEFRNIAVNAGNYAYAYYGNYAGSQISLQDFKRRFNEIAGDGEFRNIAVNAGNYAYAYF